MNVKELIKQLLDYDMKEDVRIKLDYLEGSNEEPYGTLQTAQIDSISSWHGTPVIEFTDWRK